MPTPAPARAPTEEERRPAALLLVYTWDIVLAILASLGALTVFSGHRETRGRIVDIPLSVQIFQAIADAALAVALFLIGTLLTRRSAWVRRAQFVVLGMDIALVSLSTAVSLVTDESARSLGVVLVATVFVLLDVLAVVVMTAPRVRTWFSEPGQVPLWIGCLIAFWGAASSAFFVLGVLS